VVRAKRKITEAGISLAVPPADQLAERLGDVLAVVYVMFNEGFVSSTGATQDRDLAADAVWLARVVATSVPDEPEAWGLAALLTIQHARAAARFDRHGGLVLLRHQDRALWDREAVAEGERLVDRAAALRRPGPYQLQAAIAALHATAPSWEETDWLQIALLYDELARLDPSPVVRLNQAVAHAQVTDPADALGRLEELSGDLAHYHLFHAVRAELLTALGRHEAAREANRTALGLTTNDAERRLLTTRLHRRPMDDGT
jgi:predicted RNA polymerase sigma factor